MGLQIIWNSIIEEPADVVVTPASRFPRIGSGLDKAIHAAAGPQLLKERQRLGEIGPGIVQATKSFGLAEHNGAKWIIHALGPVWEEGVRNEAVILDGCYLRALLCAVSLKCRTVSLPVLSSGRFGMPLEQAMGIAVKAIDFFLRSFPKMNVKLVVLDAPFYDYAKVHWPDRCLSRFTRKEEEAYRANFPVAKPLEMDAELKGSPEDETQDYFRGVMIRRDKRGKNFNEMFQLLWRRTQDREKKAQKWAKANSRRAASRRFLVNKNELALASLVSLSNIKHFCSTEKVNRPSKDVVIALSVAMKLDRTYTRALLEKCGHRFENTSRDEIIAEYVDRRSGDVGGLCELLVSKGEEDLVLARD
ncbi:MAG: macro domain-containing protein [Kiritimatiellae bacterium]|nr:macro domain-containing protein [Kiritimatiellia bacterium]